MVEKIIPEKGETAEKIKVVIVDDVAQTRTDIKRLLYFEEDMTVIGEAGNGKEAIALIEKVNPDVVLMDINMPVMDGIKATEVIAPAYPHVSVVIISIQGEQEYLKKAMVAGARDYMVKPLSSEEMSLTIRQAYQVGRRRKNRDKPESVIHPLAAKTPRPAVKHQTVSFFCSKGGIGKTVLASNLAVVLARKKLKVVLVDLDLEFGDLSVLLNLNEVRTISDLVQEEEEIDEERLDKYLIRHISGVYVLAAPFWPQEAEKIRAAHIEKVLTVLKSAFDCVIIDTPASFGEIPLLVLDQSDLILLPVRRDIAAIRSVKTSLNILQSLGYGEKMRAILNQADLDTGIEIAELERSLDIVITHLVSSDERKVVTSVNKGVPLCLEHSNSEISRDIFGLGEKIVRGFSYKQKSGLDKTLLNKIFSI